MANTVYDWHMLIRLTKPATLQFPESLPPSLREGETLAIGGFQPCGMWDLLYNPGTFEWLGILFWLSNKDAGTLRHANPGFDPRFARFIDVASTTLLEECEKEQCAKNSTAYMLQVIWTEAERMEILDALELADSWYAINVNPGIVSEDKSRFSTAHQFLALGIISAGSIMGGQGLSWPKEFTIPIVDSE